MALNTDRTGNRKNNYNFQDLYEYAEPKILPQ